MHDFFKITNKHKYVKKYFTDVPSWDDIIHNIDLNIQKQYEIKNRSSYGIEIFNIFDINVVDSILNEIEKNNPNKKYSAHAYISLSAKSDTLGKHVDQSYVWFWQCIGKTDWEIFENDKVYHYELSPGDFIYIPKGIFHNVKPLSPRVGISFGVDCETNFNYF